MSRIYIDKTKEEILQEINVAMQGTASPVYYDAYALMSAIQSELSYNGNYDEVINNVERMIAEYRKDQQMAQFKNTLDVVFHVLLNNMKEESDIDKMLVGDTDDSNS